MDVGSIIKWGYLLFRFSKGTYPPPISHFGFCFWGVGYLLLCWVLPFQLHETVTHIGWMWGHEGDECRHHQMEH